MRRYVPFILVAIAIPGVLFGSHLYGNWSRATRDRLVEERLTAARQVDGLSVDEAVAVLTGDGSDEAITILFTGNTAGTLEPCGCFVGQSGGVARRGAAVERLREAGLDPLLLDAGGWASDGGPLDTLKAEYYLRSMQLMRYSAVAPSLPDVEVGGGRLVTAALSAGLRPVRSSPGDGDAPLSRSARLQAGDRAVTVLGVSHSGEAVETTLATLGRAVGEGTEDSDLVVLLSSATASTEDRIAHDVEGVDLLISHSDRTDGRVGEAMVVGTEYQGTLLGYAQWRPDGSWRTGRIRLTDDMPEAPGQVALIDEFYERVRADETHTRATKRMFAASALESDESNGYLGASACKSCHAEEYEQWGLTPHAAAYGTLVGRQRHFYPDCVTCHVTGFGYETGFEIGVPEKLHLKGVGCETCHGPGKQHVSSPKKTNIRRVVSEEMCGQCHTPEQHPGFTQVVEQLLPKVDHSESIRDVKQLLVERAKLPGKPLVELAVVSMCPYGVQAEQALVPVLREFQDEIDFRLLFLGSETPDEPSRFSSMHGQAELDENMRQVMIAEHEQDKLFDYLLCRAEDVEASWETCAAKLGIDTDRIRRAMESPEGEALYLDNINRARELGAYASPMLYVGGGEVASRLFMRGSSSSGVCAP